MSSGSQAAQLQRWSSRPRVWSSQRSSLALVQQSYYSTQEAEKEPEEEPLHTIISDTEAVQGAVTAADRAPLPFLAVLHRFERILNVVLLHLMQVTSPNMSFKLRQKNCWTLLRGPCTLRKR